MLKIRAAHKSTDSRPKLSILDLFAGAGGLTLGFTQAGFESMGAVELTPDASATHHANFDVNVICSDIADVSVSSLPLVDVLVGGPPCQGFSRLGSMNRLKEHDLNGLWQHYARLVEELSPRAFVIENVPAFLKSKEYVALCKRLDNNGTDYSVAAGLLNAKDFGVPQNRVRAFVIGIRGGPPASLPASTIGRFNSVESTIGTLPLPSEHSLPFGSDTVRSGLELHFLRNPTEVSLRRYAVIPAGGNRFDLMRSAPEITPRCWLDKPFGSTDVFGRLRWDQPSVTIRTEFFKPEKGRYLHPEQDRPITHLEATLLQGFPLDFKWVGSKTSVARQIGNAVPPPLAKAVALHVTSLLD